MQSPRVYLVLDSCFAIKRWVKPRQWMQVGRDIGFTCMQASTDNEIDPLFSDEGYMADWAEDVRRAQAETGIRLTNFYTGYQTYRTVGLAHHDERNRRRLIDRWLKPMIDMASGLDAGLGFYLFAYTEEVLRNPQKYAATTDLILDQLREVADYAGTRGGVEISIEQMYSPHQPPWTIEGTLEFLKRANAPSQHPVYITIDVGHQTGQHRFRTPTRAELEAVVRRAASGESVADVWLGPEPVYELLDEMAPDVAAAVGCLEAAMAPYPYMFSSPKDSDTYAWLEAVGRWAPIIHLQQTDGRHSTHSAFTPETNRTGIVKGDQVLAALAESFAKPASGDSEDADHSGDSAASGGMPPAVENVYLSFEVFASNTETNRQVIEKLKQSHDYWRQFIPEDGLPLDELVARSESGGNGGSAGPGRGGDAS